MVMRVITDDERLHVHVCDQKSSTEEGGPEL